MSRKYYTAVSKSSEVYDNEEWHIEFGDYSQAVVVDEIEDMKQADERLQERRKYRVITSGDTQAEINEAVAKLISA